MYGGHVRIRRPRGAAWLARHLPCTEGIRGSSLNVRSRRRRVRGHRIRHPVLWTTNHWPVRVRRLRGQSVPTLVELVGLTRVCSITSAGTARGGSSAVEQGLCKAPTGVRFPVAPRMVRSAVGSGQPFRRCRSLRSSKTSPRTAICEPTSPEVAGLPRPAARRPRPTGLGVRARRGKGRLASWRRSWWSCRAMINLCAVPVDCAARGLHRGHVRGPSSGADSRGAVACSRPVRRRAWRASCHPN